MTRNPDLVGALPFPAFKVEEALSSIDQAVRALRAASGRPPLPPARLTLADRMLDQGPAGPDDAA